MLSNRRRKEIGKLTQKKYRERLGQMLVEGVRSVEAAVDAGAPLVELVVDEAVLHDERVAVLVERVDVPVHVEPPEEVARLADTRSTQGVLAVATMPWVEPDVLARCRSVLVLDAVQDPGNAGTLLRTAAWFGAGAVLAGPGTVDLSNPKVVRAAMGGLWGLQLASTNDLSAALDRLKGRGFRLYGADLSGTPAGQWEPKTPSALVLGSEAHGLSDDVVDRIDGRVCIPGAATRRGAESLNVAVAAGILVYEWLGDGKGTAHRAACL